MNKNTFVVIFVWKKTIFKITTTNKYVLYIYIYRWNSLHRPPVPPWVLCWFIRLVLEPTKMHIPNSFVCVNHVLQDCVPESERRLQWRRASTSRPWGFCYDTSTWEHVYPHMYCGNNKKILLQSKYKKACSRTHSWSTFEKWKPSSCS